MTDAPDPKINTAPQQDQDDPFEGLSNVCPETGQAKSGSQQLDPATPKKELSDTSFEFSLKSKYERVRRDRGPNVKTAQRSLDVRAATGSDRKERSTDKDKQSVKGGPVLAEDRKSKTVLDRLINWLAERIKKLEEFFMKMLGIEVTPPKDSPEAEEEEEEELTSVASITSAQVARLDKSHSRSTKKVGNS